MDRRRFHQIIGSAALLAGPRSGAAAGAPTPANEAPRWPESTYRRMLVDMHIPDWDPSFLAKFDAKTYVDLIADAGFQSLMQCAYGGPGLCLWPTRTGKMHANLKGRDLLGEVVRRCRERGLRIVAYSMVIYDNWPFENNPGWRIMRADGQDRILSRRAGLVCPNSPYREYVKSCLREIAAYDIDGVFVDMTFWPQVCYCPHCVARYRKEKGLEPPRRVDWDDRNWRGFQKAREDWMLEFAQELSDTVRSIKPLTVNHQFSTLFFGWPVGQPVEIASACDYTGGDFYGGPAAYSLACKAFYGLSRKQPFEYHTTRTPRPNEHVTTKTLDELRIEAYVATLHSGALCFIDGINPDGTLEPQIYGMLGELNKQRAQYEPYLGGQMLADIGIYYDKGSMYDPGMQGASPADFEVWSASYPHLQGVVGAARALQEAHMPFGVITNATLDQLNRYRAVILSGVLEMTSVQAAALRAFVHQGGLLYASGATSLDRFDKAGPRFLLEDVFGVRYLGKLGAAPQGRPDNYLTARPVTYLTPADESLSRVVWPQRHVTFNGPMIKAQALPGARVLATVTLPLAPPEAGTAIGSRFASLHSNPPAYQPGTSPACVVNSYGAGKAIWIAAPFETGTQAVYHRLVAHLLRSELPPPYRFEADAHSSVEVTLFEQAGKRRLLVGLLSMQQQLPGIPVDATVRVQIPAGRSIRSVLRVPERRALEFAIRGRYVEFKTGLFDPFTMAVVEHD